MSLTTLTKIHIDSSLHAHDCCINCTSIDISARDSVRPFLPRLAKGFHAKPGLDPYLSLLPCKNMFARSHHCGSLDSTRAAWLADRITELLKSFSSEPGLLVGTVGLTLDRPPLLSNERLYKSARFPGRKRLPGPSGTTSMSAELASASPAEYTHTRLMYRNLKGPAMTQWATRKHTCERMARPGEL